jgi:hypothetical protein
MISEIKIGLIKSMLQNLMIQTGINNPEEIIEMINCGELSLAKSQKKVEEIGGIFYFTVTAVGLTEKQWNKEFERKGNRVTVDVQEALKTEFFKPTMDVYQVALIPLKIFCDRDRIVKKIRREARARRFSSPTLEISLLIRQFLSDLEIEKMEIERIIFFHYPVVNLDGDLIFLGTEKIFKSDGLGTYDYFNYKFGPKDAAAFIIKKSPPKRRRR